MGEVKEVKKSPKLKRRVSLFALTVYGVGNVLGAGIYALIGNVVDLTGNMSWLAFVLASITGALTGLSYAELSASSGSFDSLWICLSRRRNPSLLCSDTSAASTSP